MIVLLLALVLMPDLQGSSPDAAVRQLRELGQEEVRVIPVVGTTNTVVSQLPAAGTELLPEAVPRLWVASLAPAPSPAPPQSAPPPSRSWAPWLFLGFQVVLGVTLWQGARYVRCVD